MAICMVRIYGNFRKLCNQFQRLRSTFSGEISSRIVIICIESQNTTLHGIHNIGIGSLHNNIADKTTAKLLHIRHHIQKSGKFFLIRELTEDQKINCFFKSKTSSVQTTDDILYIDSPDSINVHQPESVCR